MRSTCSSSATRPQEDGFPREDNAEFLGYGLVHVALDRSLRYGHFPTEIINLGPLEKIVEIYRASFVLHEQESGTVHVDLHVVPPKPDRPCFTVLPSGMSDLDMHVPSGLVTKICPVVKNRLSV